jgi:hypothetical protein
MTCRRPFKFKLLESFGQGLRAFHINRDGNIWVTDPMKGNPLGLSAKAAASRRAARFCCCGKVGPIRPRSASNG